VQFREVAALAIVVMADEKHGSLIFISSHGRSGLSRTFLGSVPVLADRPTAEEVRHAQTLKKENAIEF